MTSFLERVGVGIVLPLCLLMSFGCADYSPDIDDIHKRLDAMEDNQIATIESQIVSVNSSISNFEKADADLKEMIANLQKTAGKFEKTISENGESISALKTGLEKAVEDLKNSDRADKEYVLDSLGKAKAVLLALLESEKTEMNGKLTSINNTISYLQKKDAELEKKITDLRIYIDKELKETKDWANATFMTLDQYNAIVDQLGGIEGEIAGLKTSMTNLETRLTEKYSKDLKAALAVTNKAIEDNAKEVEGLKSDLDEVKAEVKEAYERAIRDAIASLRNELSADITAAINDADSKVQGEIDRMSSEIRKMENKITQAQNAVNKVLYRIQSLVYVPYTEDGVAVVTRYGSGSIVKFVTLEFEVRPSSALYYLKKDNIKITAHYPNNEQKDLYINNDNDFKVYGGYIVIKVNATYISDSFVRGEMAAFARVHIENETMGWNLSSEYIPLRMAE